MAAAAVKTRVVIVGGGFGGVRTARRLSGNAELEITLISREDHFAYYPQLYHAATGGVRSESSIPLSDLLDPRRVHIVRDTIAQIDPEGKTVHGASGTEYAYDQLVIALGSITNYFGIPGIQQFAYNIKTIEGAERFKAHLHQQLVDEKKTEMHYVIVGGGPTGIELSGALGEYLQRIVRLHGVKRPKYHIDLVEAAPRLLPRSPEAIAAKVAARLERLGVRVMTGATVEAETADTLRLKGKDLTTRTVVWTAGVANNPFFKENASAFTLAKNGRVEVDGHMEAQADVYVIGDNAVTPYGGQAETAINDATFVASDIVRKLAGRPRPDYRQPKPASVIPVGSGWAAAEYKGMQFYGRVGWVLRRLGDLVGYRDIEAMPKAIRVWLQDARRDDGCPICSSGAPVA